MKAFVINEKEKFEVLGDVETPTPKANEVLLKVKKVGFCGSDLNTYRGLNPMVTYPRIPGHEIAGEIVEMGSDVPSHFNLGDKALVVPYTACGECPSCRIGRVNACRSNQTLGVQREGGMTEYLTVPYEKLIIEGIEDFTYEEIALVEPLSVGFHASSRAEPQSGEIMLVFGCGLVGLGAIAKGAFCGADVIAVDLDDEKLELAKAFGAKYVVNSKKQDLNEAVAEITNGDGPSVVVEAIGVTQTYVGAIDLVSFAGRVVYVGYAKQPVEYDTKYFVMKELQIMGSRNATAQDFSDVVAAMKKLNLPVERLITKDVNVESAGEALKVWSENPALVSKILVSFE